MLPVLKYTIETVVVEIGEQIHKYKTAQLRRILPNHKTGKVNSLQSALKYNERISATNIK